MTTKEYKDFVLEKLDLPFNITCRAMMGEYLLYYNSVLFGAYMIIDCLLK